MSTKVVDTIKTAPRLKSLFNRELVLKLQKELGLNNPLEVPRLEKIVLNIGLGKSKDDKKMFEAATITLRKVTGQQPIVTKAHKSIAAFKLREGQNTGLMVTLRDKRMYEFLDRLVNVVLPRLRDFHGVSSGSFDNSGNYSIGLREQSVFPELSYEDTTTLHGLQVTIVTTGKDVSQNKTVLKALGVPFAKEGDK